MNDFIRLNIDDNYLSLGNLFRIIKEESFKKNIYWQAELFYILFNKSPADSTINNYCTGFRAINKEYKLYYKNLQNKYLNNELILLDEILSIIELLEDTTIDIVKDEHKLKHINANIKFHDLCERLYSISKNDSDVSTTLSNKLHNYITESDLYNFFIEVLFFVILTRKQPINYKANFDNIIERQIYDTDMSVNDIEDFIEIHLNSGIWSLRGIMQLANNNNPFACFEIASMEYYGIISGKRRYDKALYYYEIAKKYKHPVASWSIGYMYYTKKIGNRSKHDLYMALKHFNIARKLNCSNAYNSIGLMFLNGDVPHIKKDINKAKYYFKKAISMSNVYAYNNLGLIYEKENKIKDAIDLYKQSASLGDSWAQNKLGEYYRNKGNDKLAYSYYLDSSNSSKFTMSPYSKYNLAKYYYLTGNTKANITKDINHAIELLEDVKDDLFIANIELLYIYYDLYINNKTNKELSAYYLSKFHLYESIIINSENFDDLKTDIENMLSDIYDKRSLDYKL